VLRAVRWAVSLVMRRVQCLAGGTRSARFDDLASAAMSQRSYTANPRSCTDQDGCGEVLPVLQQLYSLLPVLQAGTPSI
jgi:hypothetical protein